MDKFLLDIGYIPKDCDSEIISCGDPDGSGTKEVSLEWVGNEISSSTSTERVNTASQNIWDPNSQVWTEVVEKFLSDLSSDKKIDPKKICGSWAIFQDEEPQVSGLKVVSEDDDGGEFANDEGEFNGHFYIRYQLQEDDEFYGEKVVVFK
jgi:hypothetical protein